MRPALASLVSVLAGAVLLAGCASPTSPPVRELTILSFNDFHGHIQAQDPTPLRPLLPVAGGGPDQPQAAGGIAYFATAMQALVARHPHALIVAGGDLIGASPLMSSLLKDEPTLSALGQLGVAATALGNHELDAGLPELLRKAEGRCAPTGCAWPDFTGPGFPFLAANVVDASTGQPVLPSHVIKDVEGLKVAIIGAITKDTPKVTRARSIQGLRFLDEVESMNALVPALKAQGVGLLIAVMHEGGVQTGSHPPANDPSYTCPTLSARGLDIAQRLDPAYAIVIQGHTHEAYTCKVQGRLVVQAGSFGGWITESRLRLDPQGRVIDAQAVNHPVLQTAYTAHPALAALVARAAALTAAARNRPVATLRAGASAQVSAGQGDSALGNLIADSLLDFARQQAPADVAFMNPDGLRADLVVVPDRPVTMSDLLTILPFGNDVIALTLSGQQLLDLLRLGLPQGDAPPHLLAASAGLRYSWSQTSTGHPVLGPVTLDGQPLDPSRDYRVVVNHFLAEGGDGHAGFRPGRDRQILGGDIDALVAYLNRTPAAIEKAAPGRLVRN